MTVEKELRLRSETWDTTNLRQHYVFSWKSLISHNNFWIITKPKLKIQLITITPDEPLFYVLYIVLTLTPISTEKYVKIEQSLCRP